MVPTFKKYLIDQDDLELRQNQLRREREFLERVEAEVASDLRNTLNTKADKVTWCPDLHPSKN